MNSRNTKESNIDKKYREIIFQYSIEDIKESKNTRVLKYEFPCPFCSAGRKGSKKKARCSALFWVENRGCFRFQCFNTGPNECKVTMEFPMFLERLNSALFRQYQWERFHAGTTGGRWNCPHPPEILNLMAGSGNEWASVCRWRHSDLYSLLLFLACTSLECTHFYSLPPTTLFGLCQATDQHGISNRPVGLA